MNFPVSFGSESSTTVTSTPEDNKDKDLKENLEFILEINLQEIIAKYASYVDCLQDAIEDKGITPEKLRAYLLTLSASSKCIRGFH